MSGITFGAGFSVRTSVTVGCAVFANSIVREMSWRASSSAVLVEEIESRVTGETVVGATARIAIGGAS